MQVVLHKIKKNEVKLKLRESYEVPTLRPEARKASHPIGVTEDTGECETSGFSY